MANNRNARVLCAGKGKSNAFVPGR